MSQPATIELTLPDGSRHQAEAGTTALAIAGELGQGLARAAIGAELDGQLVDLRQPLRRSGSLRILTAKDPEAGIFIRHSAEHVMADAVVRLWPEAQIDAGRQDHVDKFQYDFRFPRAFTPEDLGRIEEEMNRVIAEDETFEREELDREEATERLREMGDLKLKRLADVPPGEAITIFRHGRFTDLCRGPHVGHAAQIGAVKLLEASGVYWKGDERNERLQRIYGTAFASRQELKKFLDDVEQARRRDHRRLGPELDLFSFHAAAPASPFFHPRGARVYNGLIDFVRELYARYGYEEVVTPQILDVDLWHTSGHYENYREAMFFTTIDEDEYAVKPMNCPTHCLIYTTRLRSFRDLPIRYADFGRLHRWERSGVVTGLSRVRTFAQDDAHIFCTEEQIEAEVMAVADMVAEIYDTFAFEDVQVELSTRPEKSLGTAEMWEQAESALEAALRKRGTGYQISPGEGAFYGPKIDFHVNDALGREWQLGTIQLDYQMPARFGLKYVGSDGAEHQPVMIHRAIMGSLERFFGILVEHTAGAFPLWLAPVQVMVLPVSEKFLAYGQEIHQQLTAAGLRSELDERNEKLGYKIRQAQVHQVPYMVVVGAREQEAGTINVRRRRGGELGAIAIDDFVARARELATTRSRDL